VVVLLGYVYDVRMNKTETAIEKGFRRKALRLKLQAEVCAAFAIVASIVLVCMLSLGATNWFAGLLLISILGSSLLSGKWFNHRNKCKIELLALKVVDQKAAFENEVEESNTAIKEMGEVVEIDLQREALRLKARGATWCAGTIIAFIAFIIGVANGYDLSDYIRPIVPYRWMGSLFFYCIFVLPLLYGMSQGDESKECVKKLIELKCTYFLEKSISEGKTVAEAKKALLELPDDAMEKLVTDELEALEALEAENKRVDSEEA